MLLPGAAKCQLRSQRGCTILPLFSGPFHLYRGGRAADDEQWVGGHLGHERVL